MARSASQLEAWAYLLELCLDDCRVFDTTKDMRGAVIEVESELARLHKIEDAAIKLARADIATRDDDEKFDAHMEVWCAAQEEFDLTIKSLVPEAFSAQGIAARSDETPKAAQPEGQEPDPEGGAP